MKSYFNFEFLGWINKITKAKSKNGISYARIQIVNGRDFIFLHCFEDFMCQSDHICEGDWVRVKGDICQKTKSKDYYFKPTTIDLIEKNAQKDLEPSSEKDIKESMENATK